jgi:hypothetical protein
MYGVGRGNRFEELRETINRTLSVAASRHAKAVDEPGTEVVVKGLPGKPDYVPSCIFVFVPLRNASSALVPADDAIVTHAQALRKREKTRNGTLVALEERVNAGLDDGRRPKTFFVHSRWKRRSIH